MLQLSELSELEELALVEWKDEFRKLQTRPHATVLFQPLNTVSCPAPLLYARCLPLSPPLPVTKSPPPPIRLSGRQTLNPWTLNLGRPLCRG